MWLALQSELLQEGLQLYIVLMAIKPTVAFQADEFQQGLGEMNPSNKLKAQIEPSLLGFSLAV